MHERGCLALSEQIQSYSRINGLSTGFLPHPETMSMCNIQGPSHVENRPKYHADVTLHHTQPYRYAVTVQTANTLKQWVQKMVPFLAFPIYSLRPAQQVLLKDLKLLEYF